VNTTRSGGPGDVDTAAEPRLHEEPPLAAVDICKSYGPVRALQPASFALARGEIHALVGENGSGKSTVVGILSGVVKPDGGTVTFGDKKATSHTPWESQRAGTLTVFQDGSLLGDLTVAQNFYLGTPVAQRPSYRRIGEWTRGRLEQFGLDRINPGSLVDLLSPGDRQLLDIVRALMAQPAVLLLDEATSALDAAGVDVALDLMRKAASEGTAVMFVTHRLSEVFRVADRISVLRDGVWQGTHDPASIDTHGLVELMAGTSVNVEFPDRAASADVGGALLTARGLTGPGFGPVDVELRRGEILGIAGADDNGQLPLLRGLTGVNVSDGVLEGQDRVVTGLQGAVHAKVAYLSSDRRHESLFPSLPIRENLVAGVLGKLSTAGYISPRKERAESQQSVDRFGIRLGTVEDAVTSLSGGNQQKVALGRVLSTESRVILIDEPTQGVDARSRIDIYHMLRDAAAAGHSVVVVSSDAAELAGLCDRIVVMSRGRVVDEVAGANATEERIINAFTSAEHVGRGDAAAAASASEAEAVRSGRWAKAREFIRLHQDAARLALLVLMLVALAGYVQGRNSTFLTQASMYNVFLIALPLAIVAAAEFIVIFTGGIDVSVGANMGVTVAVLSFVIGTSGAAGGIVVSLLVAIGLGIVIGIVNSVIVERIRISPVIATIATLGILQGIGLLLRPKAAGAISLDVSSALTKQVGPFPVPLLVVAGMFVLADLALSRTGRGLRMRAVGLSPVSAYRLGENAPRQRQLAYVACAVLAAIAGVMLAAQVGVGDSTVGSTYTLLAVAAPILGGASLLGGRGSFIGCLVGSVLLATSLALPTVLSLSDGTSFLLTGGLTLLALLIYTRSAWVVIGRSARLLRVRLRRPRPAATPAVESA
jgi:ribose transport system ATP-binding protein